MVWVVKRDDKGFLVIPCPKRGQRERRKRDRERDHTIV